MEGRKMGLMLPSERPIHNYSYLRVIERHPVGHSFLSLFGFFVFSQQSGSLLFSYVQFNLFKCYVFLSTCKRELFSRNLVCDHFPLGGLELGPKKFVVIKVNSSNAL